MHKLQSIQIYLKQASWGISQCVIFIYLLFFKDVLLATLTAVEYIRK